MPTSSPSIRMALLILLVSAALILFASAAMALDGDLSADVDMRALDNVEAGGIDTGSVSSTVPVSAVPAVGAVGLPETAVTDILDDGLATVAGATESATGGSIEMGEREPKGSEPRVSTSQAGPASYIATGAKSGAIALGATGLLGALLWAKEAIALGASRFLFGPLFSRIDKGEMMENEGRECLYNLVAANPGVSLSELATASGFGWGTTVYHLGRLEQAGYVTSIKNGQARLFFQKDHGAVQNKRAIAVLRNQTAGDLARFLVATPGATQTTIGRSLGLGAPTVTKYVKRFEAEGLVQVTADGRSKIVQPTETLTSAMMHVDAPTPTVGVATAVGPQAIAA